MSAMGIFSQKGKHYYDRREWAGDTVIWMLGIAFSSLLLSTLVTEDRRFGFYAIAVIAPFLFLADFNSLRIVITSSDILVHQAFFLRRRTIFYSEILDIAFKNSAKYAHLDRNIRKKNLSSGPGKPEIIINLLDNDYLIIAGSKYAEEILAAIRLARPHIKID